MLTIFVSVNWDRWASTPNYRATKEEFVRTYARERKRGDGGYKREKGGTRGRRVQERRRGGRKNDGGGTDNVEFLSIASGKVSTGAHGIQRELESPVSQLAGVCPGPNLDLCDGNKRNHCIHSHYDKRGVRTLFLGLLVERRMRDLLDGCLIAFPSTCKEESPITMSSSLSPSTLFLFPLPAHQIFNVSSSLVGHPVGTENAHFVIAKVIRQHIQHLHTNHSFMIEKLKVKYETQFCELTQHH